MFAGGSCLKLCLSKLESFRDWFKWPGSNWRTLSFNFPRIYFAESVKFSQTPQDAGANFFPFVFRFLTYLLSCILFLFALRYFVNYAPLLRAVCKFRYSLLSRPYLLPVFYVSICVTSFVEVDYLFPRWPWPPTLLTSAFGKQLGFHRFFINFILQSP